jgi:DNA-binding response OmpR family regulator
VADDPAGAGSPAEAARAARILVVEDDPDLARIVELNLSHVGYDVDLATDGRGGLERAREDDPDLVLLDVMMPLMDGWEVLRELKSDEATRDIPVVMLTALSEERDVIQGHLEGAVRYITKPFEMRELLDTVAEALEPLDEVERERRRERVRGLLRRLAEIDAGRPAESVVQVSRLESLPRRPRERTPDETDRERLGTLTPKQRRLAEQLASGRTAREIAADLDVSRSNVYATRKRVARKLGVEPGEVAAEARRLGL